MAESENFEKVKLADLELKKGDIAPFDLYVFLHASGRYHAIVKRGETINETHWSNLLRLQDANLFVKSDANFEELKSKWAPNPNDVLAALKKPLFRGDVLGDEAKKKLQDVYVSLLKTNVSGKGVSQTLTDLSESLLEVLVPEARDAKSAILQQLRHMHLMNHAAAISSLAMLTALGTGFESRTAFSNLAFACLLMDAGLVEVSEKDLTTYYKNRSEVPAHVMDRIRLHPMKSEQMLQGMKEINETVQQLVLLHHELHNGTGYHRGLRTGNTSPLARTLSFSVDLYEYIKGAELRGEPISLGQAIQLLAEKRVAGHERRHGAEISAKLMDYLSLK
ncbi:MAG: HD domain-containing phosphohydrolase [Bdellovibrionota bacterium]